MSKLIKLDDEYANWIKEVSNRFRSSQIKAAVKVNDEMLRFYWMLGKDIYERENDNGYGKAFYKNLSSDIFMRFTQIILNLRTN